MGKTSKGSKAATVSGEANKPGKRGKAIATPARKRGHEAVAKIQTAQQELAATGASHIGNLISWNVPDDLDIPRAEVRALLGSVNLEKLCPDLAPTSALRRAISEGRGPKGHFAREFARASDDRSCAHGIYRARGEGESGDAMLCGARVRLDGERAVALPPEGKTGEEEALSWAAQLAARANHLVDNCTGRDVSAALVKVGEALAAVPLRDRGGFYLLAPASCPTWAALVPRLRELGFWMITVELFGTPGNLEAAGEAAKGALETDLAQLAVDLEKARTEGMRESSLELRLKTLEDLRAKAELYRGVLTGTAEAIGARMAELTAAFTEKLDENRAAVARGDKPVVSDEVAQRRSEAARKAHLTRKANAAQAPATV